MAYYDEADLLGGMNVGKGASVAGKASNLGGLASKIMGYMGPVGSALGIVDTISGLFRKSEAGKRKISETKTQQGLEKAATDIQKAVASGQMDADTAIMALKNLAEMSSDDPGGLAAITINNVMSDVVNRRGYDTSEPLDGTALRGQQSFQRDRLATLLRNGYLGTELGGDLANTPAGEVFKPRKNALDSFGDITKQVQEMFPRNNAASPFADYRETLKKRLIR